MVSTSEYSKIFDSGIDFAVNAINEHCGTEFKTLAEAIMAIRTMKDALTMQSDSKEVV
jgi:hypothetical protein